MRVYIAGPMTGLPDYNYPAFYRAAADLRAAGYDVESPAEKPEPECGTWEGYLRQAITQMLTCDTVALLQGWERSRGAVLEFNIARALKMKPRPITAFLSSGHRSNP